MSRATLLIMSFLVGSLAHEVSAATIIVKPGDSIQQAISRMHGGDTVTIQGGTYHEGQLSPPGGSEGNATTIQAEAGEIVTILSTGGDCMISLNPGVTWVVMDGLILDGDGKVAFGICNQKINTTSHLTVQNSEVRNTRHSGLLLNGTTWTIRNNYIHHCGTDKQFDHGIYFAGNHSLILGNVFEANACFNIQNYGDGEGDDHNTYDGNLFTKSRCGFVASNGHTVLFTGNILIDDGMVDASAALQAFIPDLVIRKNWFVRTGILSRGDSSLRIEENQFCEGGIKAPNAQQSGNRFTCDNLPDLTKAPGATPIKPPQGTKPTMPRNVRVFTRE